MESLGFLCVNNSKLPPPFPRYSRLLVQFSLSTACASLYRTRSGWTPKFRTTTFGAKTRCRKYFDILNRLRVTHECDRQTDGHQMPRFLHYVVWQKNYVLIKSAWKFYQICMWTTKNWLNFELIRKWIRIWEFFERFFNIRHIAFLQNLSDSSRKTVYAWLTSVFTSSRKLILHVS